MSKERFSARMSHPGIIFALIALWYCPAHAEVSQNLLSSSDFESATISPWNTNAWGGSMTAALTSPGRLGSGKSARLIVSANPDAVIFRQNLNLEGGSLYRGGLWVKADRDTSIIIRVRKTSPHYNVWGQHTLNVGTEWKYATFDAAPVEDNTVRFEIALTEVAVNVYIDDTSLTKLSDKYDPRHYTFEPNRVVPNTLFGLHINRGHVIDLWPAVATVSPGIIRLWDTGTDWMAVESAKNAFDWRRLELYLTRIKTYLPDSKIIYTFGRVPGWANGQRDMSSPPLNLEDWKDFVTTLVDRFGKQIDYYETWNEYNYKLFWSGTQQQMLAMSKILKEVVSANDPTAIVLLPNITATGLHVLDEYLMLGGAEYADAASVHVYAPADSIEEYFVFPSAVRDILKKHGRSDMAIYNTEGALTISEGTALTTSQERSSVARYYIMTWLAGLENSGWYFWENKLSMGRVPLVEDTATFSSPTSGGIAYKSVREWLVGTNFKRLNINPETGVFIAELVMANGGEGIIAWSTDATPTNIVHERPVREIRNLDGTRSSGNAPSVAIGAEPILILYDDVIQSPAKLEVIK